MWRSKVDKNWEGVGGMRRDHMSKQDMAPINFAIPESGPRLGIFGPLGANVEVMPSGRPNFTEVCI